jgi:hypothetical protein
VQSRRRSSGRSALAGQTWNCLAARLDREDCIVTLVFRASITGIQKAEDGYGCYITLHAGDVRECSSSSGGGGSCCSSSRSSSWSFNQQNNYHFPRLQVPRRRRTLISCPVCPTFQTQCLYGAGEYASSRFIRKRGSRPFRLSRRLSRGDVERTARDTVMDTDTHNYRITELQRLGT